MTDKKTDRSAPAGAATTSKAGKKHGKSGFDPSKLKGGKNAQNVPRPQTAPRGRG